MNNKKSSRLDGILSHVERVGNALPAPAFLFAMLAAITLVISLLGSSMGWGGVNPANGEVIAVRNLLSREGVHNIISTLVTNFTGFAPLGVVFVSVLGVGLAESSGLIRAVIVALLSRVRGAWVTFMVAMIGILSSLAADVGYILVIPIGGVIFHSLSRNPLVGMAVAFAGVSGGFSANLVISSVDVMLAGITTSAAQIIEPTYVVSVLSNYYFMVASTFVISIVATLVTERIVEPRLGKYVGEVEVEPLVPLTKQEKRALLATCGVAVAWVAVLAYGVIPENGYLRDLQTNSAIGSVLFTGFVSILFLICATCGLTYGFMTKKFRSADDVLTSLNSSSATLASLFVLVFFSAQFIAWFNQSNLGIVMAIKGVEIIKSLNVGIIPLVVVTTLFTAMVNIIMGSAIAKWLLLAPIVVPMFMMLGYPPELAQCAYRIGDSTTNIITPLMSYFPLIIVYFQRYKSDAGLGTIISAMLPYSLAMLLSWLIFIVLWIWVGLPLGV